MLQIFRSSMYYCNKQIYYIKYQFSLLYSIFYLSIFIAQYGNTCSTWNWFAILWYQFPDDLERLLELLYNKGQKGHKTPMDRWKNGRVHLISGDLKKVWLSINREIRRLSSFFFFSFMRHFSFSCNLSPIWDYFGWSWM